jgi:D-tyrosyl-tRNA(Tyr) deacylase
MGRIVIQRCKRASVSVDGKVVASIGRGVCVLVGLGAGDDDKDAELLAKKIVSLRLWDDSEGGRWKASIKEIQGEVLLVSQFTLFARVHKGNKPVFVDSLAPDVAKPLFDRVVKETQTQYGDATKVQMGVFGEMMDVELVNDGPVTIIYDSKKKD